MKVRWTTIQPRYYKLSGDKKGLIAYCKQKSGKTFSYHIHSDELTDLEKWIRKLLLRTERMKNK